MKVWLKAMLKAWIKAWLKVWLKVWLEVILKVWSAKNPLNFTFLRFPLLQRSISLQNDIGLRITLGVLLFRADGIRVVQGGSPMKIFNFETVFDKIGHCGAH